MNTIISGCVEVLDQGETFLETVSLSSYQEIIAPYFISSSGEHMRHILDHFVAIMNGHDSGHIDYDKRMRGSAIEKDIASALKQLREIKAWVSNLDESLLDKSLTITSEVSIKQKLTSTSTSSLDRELVFAASHAVHHFSIIAIAMQMQDLDMDINFGIAPATATYLRTHNTCAP